VREVLGHEPSSMAIVFGASVHGPGR